MKRWLMVLMFFFTASLSETSQAGGARHALKSIVNSIKEITISLTKVFVDADAVAETSPTKIKDSMTLILDMNDKQRAGRVNVDEAGELVTVGIQ